MADDPFATLGLPARAELPDEEVRAAWKRIAAATHPDREDGGDAARYAAAAAAYDTLRTSFGRGEALADLGLGGAPQRAARHARRAGAPGTGESGRRGWRIALRVTAAAGVTVTCVLVAGWTPGSVGLLAGALTWVAVTCRHDVPGRGAADRPGRPGCGIQSAPPGARSIPHLASRRLTGGFGRVVGYSGDGPVATGRAGSVIQFDQEPT